MRRRRGETIQTKHQGARQNTTNVIRKRKKESIGRGQVDWISDAYDS